MSCTNVQLVASLDYNLLCFDDCLHKCGVYDYTIHICSHLSTLYKEKEEQSQEERGRLQCRMSENPMLNVSRCRDNLDYRL